LAKPDIDAASSRVSPAQLDNLQHNVTEKVQVCITQFTVTNYSAVEM